MSIVLLTGCGQVVKQTDTPEPQDNPYTGNTRTGQDYYNSFIDIPIVDSESACKWTNTYIVVKQDRQGFEAREGYYTFCIGYGNDLDIALIVQYELKGSLVVESSNKIGVIYNNEFIYCGSVIDIPVTYNIITQVMIKNRK